MRAAARRAGGRLLRLPRFAAHFGWLFLKSNALVALEILTPRSRIAPVVVRMPLRCRGTGEVFTMAHLISLTPGTLTMEVESASDTTSAALYVHGMFAPDAAEFLQELRDLETELLRFWRPGPPPREES
ncbi:Na+/H+ antiporter subunit E [Streptomyces sp. YIM 98790]|uniref:Na+/H+ antiporter subunit E n=1 Tax=Streptomyces sp. YIM 98790 TaxID=2689077 RepID=UPI00140E5EA8|nr:Na+/H+ antiporter subunit E [Streptomyces sp. YIM 98790]